MKGNIFFKTAVLCMAMIVGCISLTACSDDDQEPEVTNDLTAIKAEYSVSLSKDWYKFYNIEVTYTSETGDETITLNRDWSFDMEIPYSAEPDKFVCNVIARPKPDAPAVEADSTYLLQELIHAEVSGIFKDGTQDAEYGSSGDRIGSQYMSSKVMAGYITRERILLSFLFVPENDSE